MHGRLSSKLVLVFNHVKNCSKRWPGGNLDHDMSRHNIFQSPNQYTQAKCLQARKGAKKPHAIITNNKRQHKLFIKIMENNANTGVLDHNQNKKTMKGGVRNCGRPVYEEGVRGEE